MAKSESARQSCWCWTNVGRELKTTDSESRNAAMYKEATAFHKKLTSCQNQIKHTKKANDDLLRATNSLLSGPQPGVWDANDVGVPMAVRDTSTGPMSEGYLRRTNSLEHKNLVADPIAAWQEEYARLKARLAEEHTASLAVDAARRAYYKRSRKSLKENVLNKDQMDQMSPDETKDAEMMGVRGKHQKIEAEIHREMIVLVDGAEHMGKYLAHALRVEADSLKAACDQMEAPASAHHAVETAAPGPTAHMQPNPAPVSA